MMEPLQRSIVWDLSGLPTKASRLRTNVAVHPCNRRVEVMPTIMSSEHVMDSDVAMAHAHRSVSEVALVGTAPVVGVVSEERVGAGSDVSGTAPSGGNVSSKVSGGGSGTAAVVAKPSSTTVIEMEPGPKTDDKTHHPPAPPSYSAAAFMRQLRPECHRLDIIHTKPLRKRLFLLEFDMFEFVLLSELFFTASFFMFSMFLLAIGLTITNTMLVAITFGTISIPSMIAYTKAAPHIALMFFIILTLIEFLSESLLLLRLYISYQTDDKTFVTLSVQTYLILFLMALQACAGFSVYLWPYKPIKKFKTCDTIKGYAARSWELFRHVEPYEPSLTDVGTGHHLITEPTMKTGTETQTEPPLIPVEFAVPSADKPPESAPKPPASATPPKSTASPKKVPSIVANVTSAPTKTETVRVPVKDPHKPARSIPKEASTEDSEQKSNEAKCIKVTQKSKTPPSKPLSEPPRTPMELSKANLPQKKPSSTGSDSRNISVEMPSPPRAKATTKDVDTSVKSTFAPMKLGASAAKSADPKPKESEQMSDQDKPTRTPEITR